jgi:2'-5' RNA ligase
MSRLFLAVRPDDATFVALEALDRDPAPGVRWVPPEQWHITLRFWADVDPAAVIEAIDAGVSDDDGRLFTAPTITLGPVVSRMGPSTVVLPAHGADQLARAVRELTVEIPPRESQPFQGHLTLARLRRRAACGVAGERFSATFIPSDLELVESELGPNGARHRVLASWPLGT